MMRMTMTTTTMSTTISFITSLLSYIIIIKIVDSLLLSSIWVSLQHKHDRPEPVSTWTGPGAPKWQTHRMWTHWSSLWGLGLSGWGSNWDPWHRFLADVASLGIYAEKALGIRSVFPEGLLEQCTSGGTSSRKYVKTTANFRTSRFSMGSFW